MNFTCNRELLQKCVMKAERVTGKNLSLPILSSILILTENNSITIRATNLDIGLEFSIPAEVSKTGSVALSGTLLSNILTNIPDEENISFLVENNICKIKTRNKNITIKGLITDDFPTIPAINDEQNITIKTQTLIQCIKSVVLSAAISDIKPEISSVYIYNKNNKLFFIATDSFRLSEKSIDFEGDGLLDGLIIPVKNIIEIIKILESIDENLLIKYKKNQISFVCKSVYITSRVIQGVYPDYKQIIPKNNTTEVVVLKQDLINVLKLSTLFSDKFNKINFSINPKEKKCLINTKNSDIGEIESNLSVAMSGEQIDISLNGKHLFDFLNTINQDSVIIQFNGFNKPAVFQGVNDNSFIYLTMPLTK